LQVALGEATANDCEAADAKGDLGLLVDYALVATLPRGERLRLHPLLREYAEAGLKHLSTAESE
jgi:hypothetical protein